MCLYILVIVVDRCVADNGMEGKRGTEHHSFQGLAPAQSYVCLSVGEGGVGVNNSMFKSKSLAFMDRDGPCRFHRVLLENPFLFFGYFFRFLVQHIFAVCPFFGLDNDFFIPLFGADGEAIFIYNADFANHTIVIAFFR